MNVCVLRADVSLLLINAWFNLRSVCLTQVLEFSKLTAAVSLEGAAETTASERFSLARAHFSLAQVFDEIVAAQSAAAARKEIDVVVIVSDELVHKTLVGDVQKLKQAVSHLVHNAVKFSGSGGMVTVVAEVCAQEEAEWAPVRHGQLNGAAFQKAGGWTTPAWVGPGGQRRMRKSLPGRAGRNSVESLLALLAAGDGPTLDHHYAAASSTAAAAAGRRSTMSKPRRRMSLPALMSRVPSVPGELAADNTARVVITVIDEGAGIPLDDHHLLFKPFVRFVC